MYNTNSTVSIWSIILKLFYFLYVGCQRRLKKNLKYNSVFPWLRQQSGHMTGSDSWLMSPHRQKKGWLFCIDIQMASHVTNYIYFFNFWVRFSSTWIKQNNIIMELKFSIFYKSHFFLFACSLILDITSMGLNKLSQIFWIIHFVFFFLNVWLVHMSVIHSFYAASQITCVFIHP